MSGIKGVDLLAPTGEGRNLVFYRPFAVSNVVDLSAKGVDGIHPVTAMPREQTHRPVERRSGCLDTLSYGLTQRRLGRLFRNGDDSNIVHPRKPCRTPTTSAAMKSDFCSPTRFARGSPRRSRRSRRVASS